MPLKYPHIIGAVAATPWAIHPSKGRAILEVLRERAIRGAPAALDAHDDEYERTQAERMTPAQDRKIAAQDGGVAVLPLLGVISQRMDMMTEFSGGTSTERFAKQFMSLVSNGDVKAIIIDVDSPGGAVTGTPELAEIIFNARGSKPIIAQVNSLAASAAYWIAAAASEVVCTPTGEVGSIGVYTVHEDISKMLEAEGFKETFIYAGKYKVEGNPYEPLGDDAKAAMQSRVDDYYGMFLRDVAKGRGVSVSDVEKNYGQGRVFGAEDALKAGMIDRVGTMAQTLERFGVKLYGGGNRGRASPVERMRREAQLLSFPVGT